MKGKKYDAAEKHFAKQRASLEAKIKSLESKLHNAQSDALIYKTLYDHKVLENDNLKSYINKLLGYTGLTLKDIALANEKDKRINSLLSLSDMNF